MGTSDWTCVILGYNQQQTIYCRFSALQENHKHTSLKMLKEIIANSWKIYQNDKLNEFWKYYAYEDGAPSDYESPLEPNLAVVVMKTLPFFIPWEIARLLHIGQKDRGSILSCLPKDIFKEIIRYARYSRSDFFEAQKTKQDAEVQKRFWSPDGELFRFVNLCGSSADDWCFFINTSSKTSCKLFYGGADIPFELGFSGFATEKQDQKLEQTLNLTLHDQHKQHWVNSIHPQAFIHILLEEDGASPEMLIDICENESINQTLRNSWMDMTYGEALSAIRSHFIKLIRPYFTSSELLSLKKKLQSRSIWNGYITIDPIVNVKKQKLQ